MADYEKVVLGSGPAGHHAAIQAAKLGRCVAYSLKGTQVVIEQWRVQYTTRRPHSSLGYRPPAPAACRPSLYPDPLSRPMAVK